LAALPGSAASHASFMAFISSCLSVSFFTSISSYETKELSLANSFKNLNDSKKIGFVLTLRSKLICCRFAIVELFDWFDKVLQLAFANHKRRKNMFSFSQSGTKTILFCLFSRA